MTLDWSPQQNAALDAVEQYLDSSASRGDYFYLAGYAGTGKTTLAREFTSTNLLRVAYASYTGKAVNVLSKKGCTPASTISRLIYGHPFFWACDQEPEHNIEECVLKNKCLHARRVYEPPELKEDALDKFDLVIIDEVSMVNRELGEDLLSFNKPILVLGDPGQLPPIKGTGFFTSREPDIMLTEIHRQAEDNPIIQLASKVRKGETLLIGDYGLSNVVPRRAIKNENLLDYDVIITGMNETRVSLNKRCRALKGIDPESLPHVGEQIMCLRNSIAVGIFNGQIFTVEDIDSKPSKKGFIEMTISDGGFTTEVEARVDCFNHPNPEKEKMGIGHKFDYGYVVTSHKSQGSEWPKVLVVDESRVFPKQKKEWLYTAITRASDKVTIAL